MEIEKSKVIGSALILGGVGTFFSGTYAFSESRAERNPNIGEKVVARYRKLNHDYTESRKDYRKTRRRYFKTNEQQLAVYRKNDTDYITPYKHLKTECQKGNLITSEFKRSHRENLRIIYSDTNASLNKLKENAAYRFCRNGRYLRKVGICASLAGIAILTLKDTFKEIKNRF